jgi:hypothetical protein
MIQRRTEATQHAVAEQTIAGDVIYDDDNDDEYTRRYHTYDAAACRKIHASFNHVPI